MNAAISSRSPYWIISFSILIGLMLVMLPLPEWAKPFRPDWIALILIYWCMALPSKAGIATAFFSGLLLDVTLGTLLGQHALGLIIITFIVLKQHQRLRVYPTMQQSIFIMILLIVKQLSVLWVDGMIGRAPQNMMTYFIPSFIALLLWPWVFILLRDFRRKFSAV